MLKRTEGIVLRSTPFGEADLIVTFFTLDYGIVKLFAKSPRKIKSRFGSSLEPITNSRLSFWGKEDTDLPRLTQSDIIHSFQRIRDNVALFLKVSEMIELILCFIPERDANKKAYYLLQKTLQNIDDRFQSSDKKSTFKKSGSFKNGSIYDDVITVHFKLRLLKLVGFAPQLESCGRCGKDGSCFYTSQGSILCERCAMGVDMPIRISPPVVSLYNNLLSWETSKIERIKPAYSILSDLSDVINTHIQYVLEKPLKTNQFFRVRHAG
jgi:DNA repair protein RecO (recombination protein O)